MADVEITPARMRELQEAVLRFSSQLREGAPPRGTPAFLHTVATALRDAADQVEQDKAALRDLLVSVQERNESLIRLSTLLVRALDYVTMISCCTWDLLEERERDEAKALEAEIVAALEPAP